MMGVVCLAFGCNVSGTPPHTPWIKDKVQHIIIGSVLILFEIVIPEPTSNFNTQKDSIYSFKID